MNSIAYYDGARAFLAFDAFMVVVFTVTLLGLARAMPHPFARTLALFWLVQAVRVAERALYFALGDRMTTTGAILAGVLLTCGVLSVQLIRMAASSVEARPRLRAGFKTWGVGAFLIGFVLHMWTVQLGAVQFEEGTAVWSRLYIGIPLGLMLITTSGRRRSSPALAWLYWGFVIQVVAFVLDGIVRLRSFGGGFTSLDSMIAAACTVSSTLALGLSSVLAVVEHERAAMLARSARLDEAHARAAESARWQHVGQLARGVAHDFNNVLGVILSGSQLAEDSVQHGSSEVVTDFEELQHAVERGRSLTQRLLRFANENPASPRPVRIGQVTRDLVPMLRRVVDQQRELRVNCADTQDAVIDPTAVEQILLNLVVNARDATTSGGRIDVQVVDEILSAPSPAAVGALAPGQYIRLSVEDTGIGIPASVQSRLWEPFFTTKGERGSGIGLPTVAAIVVEARGAIEVSSTEHVGTRFSVWLPRAGDAYGT